MDGRRVSTPGGPRVSWAVWAVRIGLPLALYGLAVGFVSDKGTRESILKSAREDLPSLWVGLVGAIAALVGAVQLTRPKQRGKSALPLVCTVGCLGYLVFGLAMLVAYRLR